MPCYCGIHTKANKIRWGVFGVCGLIAFVFFIAWANANQNCRDSIDRVDGAASPASVPASAPVTLGMSLSGQAMW